MGRLIVLCLIFLSVLSFPGSARAIIIGEVWSTNAYNSALNPSIGPPTGLPDATFEVESINFDSRRIQDINERSQITYNQFLNGPTKWNNSTNPKLGLQPGASMFATSVPDQGIFFRFTMPLAVPEGPLQLTITHDDGFYFFIPNVYKLEDADASDPVKGPEPAVTSFVVTGLFPGTYTAVIDFGVLNDTANHVLLIGTPEPWTILLLGLGMIGIGILRRKI